MPPTEYDAEVVCRHDPEVPRLGFEHVPDLKVVKTRVHLDLASASAVDQTATVDRLRRMGGTLVEPWSTDVPRVVLADVEHNEFCVLEPRDRYGGAGTLAAIVVDGADPVGLGEAAKNRVHLDLAPSDEADTDGEADRLRAFGANDVDVGQPSTASWRVLADVEGNEFCVLSPR